VTTLEQAASDGSVKVTIENFHAISDTKHPDLQPYMGTGDLKVQNASNKTVTFVVVEGAVFKPASQPNAQTTAGTSEQTLLSHQDTAKPANLPTTGDGSHEQTWLGVAAFLAGLGLLIGARVLQRASAPVQV
jgi:LPXTG-motif cell wall-anchored protein